MSSPPVQFTHTSNYTTSHSASVNLEQPPISPLPGPTLLSFDLQFDNLKDYLNNVSQVVNQQGLVLGKLIEELKSRVTVQDMMEVFGSIGETVKGQLGTFSHSTTGDQWSDQLNWALGGIGFMAKNISELQSTSEKTEADIAALRAKIKKKCSKKKTKEKIKKAKKEAEANLKTKADRIDKDLSEIDKKVCARISELEKKFAELEMNTGWKIKDCEDLLRVRVNEKYVMDAIQAAQEKIKKEILNSNENTFEKYEKVIRDVQFSLEKFNSDYSGKFRTLKNDMKKLEEEFQNKFSNSEIDDLRYELEKIKETMKKEDITSLNGKLSKCDQTLDKLRTELEELISQFSQNDSSEEVQDLKSIISSLQEELENKVDKSVMQELLQHKGNKPKVQVHENPDIKEFWKFREKAMEQFRSIEAKVEKLSKLSEIHNLKRLIQTKANEEEVKNELNNQETKVAGVEKIAGQNTRDIESLSVVLKRINLQLQEVNSNPSNALIGRKTMPTACLSCGRGDTNFGPLSPQVMGVDGRMYRAEKKKKPNHTSNYDPDVCEVDAYTMESHTHKRSFEEDKTYVQYKAPLNVILGKTRSNFFNQRALRPNSAKR